MNLAISIKQPWASLVVTGLKTIEIRRWPTRRRGPVLIHTGRVADARPESWSKLPSKIAEFAQQKGGIIGEARLVECRTYTTAEAFARDQPLHHNKPSWFCGPVMYGFVFADAKPLPFRRQSGALYFFEVPAEEPLAPAPPAGLLVSVRNAAEATVALEGGADVIDIKEPRHGSLGRPSNEVIAEILRVVGNHKPVSAALGELADGADGGFPSGLSYIKCGLAKLGKKDWQRQLMRFRQRVAKLPNPPEVVTVAYADWKRAAAPPWQDVARFALRQRGGVLLVDTFDKIKPPPGTQQIRHATLLDWIKLDELKRLCQDCREAGVKVALAGSLRMRQIVQLADVRPTWFAVRGAVCEANKRDGEVHYLKVRDLAQVLRWRQQPAIVESSRP